MAAQRVLGLLLVVLGAGLLVAIWTGVGPEVLIALLGAGFLAAYAATRTYGFLVPGGILSGLGVGIVVAAQGGPGASVVVGLGVGFLAIAVVDLVVGGSRTAWWWPLIPGGVLTTVGAAEMATVAGVERFVVPAVLIVIGLVLLLRRPAVPAADTGHPAVASTAEDEPVAHGTG